MLEPPYPSSQRPDAHRDERPYKRPDGSLEPRHRSFEASFPSLTPPFDIPCDLVTPVSAFRKLAPLGARYLLESVENGHSMQLGRYSLSRVWRRSDRSSRRGRVPETASLRLPAPTDRAGLLNALRASLDRAYAPKPHVALPFTGGLVGAAGFDVLRRFDRVRSAAPQRGPSHPDLAYVSTRSLLVFDHPYPVFGAPSRRVGRGARGGQTGSAGAPARCFAGRSWSHCLW